MHPLLDIFEQTASKHAARLAACDQSLALDYAAFQAVARGLASVISQRTTSQTVGIMAPTSAAGAAAIFACWYAGKTPVPLNFLLAPEELAKVVRDAGLDLILTIEHFEPALAHLGVATLRLDARSLVPGNTPPPPADPHDTAVILYTSGTAAEPKGVCLTFANVVGNVQACLEHARIDSSQVFLSVLPQFHSFGFTAMTIVPLLVGSTAWFLPRFSPVVVVQTIAEKRATIFMAVASMYAALAQMKSADRAALSSLSLAVSGGEPLPIAVAQIFADRFGVDIMEGYGLTESSPVATINVPWANRLGSVGRPLPGITISVEDDRRTPPRADAEGELVIRGHCVMRGYHNKPEATAAAIRGGGLWTGDVGRVDADGFVHITGRAKDMLIIGGENVYPREIENVLCEHPAVAEAAVIGRRDGVRGEIPVAFVMLKESAVATETELREHCRGCLAGYKVPREVVISANLPRGPTGKILKRALG